MLKSVFFITHNHPEEEAEDSSSHRNTHEGDFLIALCRYLVQQERTFWHLIVTTTVCALAIFGILCFSLRSYVHYFIPCSHSTNTTVEPTTVTSNPLPEIPEPSQRTHFPRNDELSKDVTFTGYPLKQAE